MKNISLIFLLTVFSGVLISQDYENPVNWYTSNSFSLYNSAGLTVFKSADAYEGNYAARVESKYAALLGRAIAGVMTTGILKDGVHVSGGQLFTSRPQKLTGYYKYSTQLSDMASLEVLLTTWNTATHKRDTVTYDKVLMPPVMEYTLFEIPLTYKNTAYPDTQLIVISSNANRFSPIQGSVLVIDNVSFSDENNTALVNEHHVSRKINVYPNPTNNHLNITVAESSDIQICNIDGSVIFQLLLQANEIHVLDVNGFRPGVYLIKADNDKYSTIQKVIIN